MLDSLKKLFTKKRSLDDLTLDELRREKIRLDQQEGKVAQQVEELEKKKQGLFLKGKDEPSQRQQMIIARKIKELDVQARNMDKNLRFFSRQLRIINAFIQLKENQAMLQQAGVSSMISRIDLATLRTYVEQASVDGAFHMEKFSEILGTLEEPGLMEEVGEDKDIMEIMKAMQEAKSAEETEPELAVEEGLRRVDEILGKEEAEPDF